MEEGNYPWTDIIVLLYRLSMLFMSLRTALVLCLILIPRSVGPVQCFFDAHHSLCDGDGAAHSHTESGR